jgi:hypothetical protein
MKLRFVVLILFFGFQIVGIIYSRLVPERYFSWAPYDQLSFYTIEAEIEGKKLTSSEVSHRYNLPSSGRENRSISNLIGVIRQYELRYGKGEKIKVKVAYQTNGKSEKTWNWPEH